MQNTIGYKQNQVILHNAWKQVLVLKSRKIIAKEPHWILEDIKTKKEFLYSEISMMKDEEDGFIVRTGYSLREINFIQDMKQIGVLQ